VNSNHQTSVRCLQKFRRGRIEPHSPSTLCHPNKLVLTLYLCPCTSIFAQAIRFFCSPITFLLSLQINPILKMFARSVVRSASRAAAPSFTKTTRANFSVGAKRMQEVVAERKIPTSSYVGGTAQRSTIAVGDEHVVSTPTVEKVTPLTQAVFNSMTPSMQKMTIMGKVVVVTGYVLSCIWH
jgi:hypothetical protein